MALTKATYGMISADTSTIDLNIDANTLYIDSSANNVGIGTNSPADRLHIASTGNILLDNALELRSKDTGGNVRTIVRVNSSNQLQYGWSANAPVLFMGGGSYTERMRIHTNGDIGIGTTSPNVKLVVSEASGDTALAINDDRSNANDYARIDFRHDNITGSQIKSQAIEDFSSSANRTSDLTFHTRNNGTIIDAMHIQEDGKVGIGRTDPGYAFDVKASDGDATARFLNSAGEDTLVRIIGGNYNTELDARLFLGEADTYGMTLEYDGVGNIGYIGMNDNVQPTASYSKRIGMSRGGTEVFFTAGNVGIGTASPSSARLEIKGAKTQSGGAPIGNLLIADSTALAANTGGGITFQGVYQSGGAITGLASIEAMKETATHNQYGGALVLKTREDQGAMNETMRLTSTGKVGIGTTSPSKKLHVAGVTNTDGIKIQGAQANVSLIIENDATNGVAWDISSTGGGHGYGDGALHFGVGFGQPKVKFQSDGKVGIGTNSPAHPLSVSAANAKIVAHSTADSQTIGFHAKYLDHATLYGSFEYTTGDAQLYIDNHFAGNNAAYSTINFRNCNNNSNTLQTRMSIAGSTGMVTVNNRLRVANGATATAGTVALEVLGNRNDSVVPANASAKFYAYTDGDGLALGNYTSSPFGSYLQAGYLLDSYGTAYNNGYPITLNPVGGNVGIGACGKDPLDILHIERSVNGAVQIQVDNQNTGNASYAGLYLNGQGNGFYLKNWGDSVSGKSNVTEFNTTASNQYMIFTPGNTHTLSLFNDESEFGSATADSKVTINPPNTSNNKTKTPTVIGFYHYYKTSPNAAYVHMKTNMPTGGNTGTFGMIAIEATGYKYSSGDVIKGMWGFHNWNSGTYQSVAANLISSSSNGFNFCSGTYVSSDGYIVLVANSGGTTSVYLGARLDFIDIQADYARHSSAYWPPAVTAVSWSNNSTGVY